MLRTTVADGEPLHVKAVFEYLPDFSINGCQEVHVEKPAAEVRFFSFQSSLRLRESRATIEPVEEDRALTDGDWAQISYAGNVKDDEAAPPVAGEDALVEIGGKETLTAFNEALRGAKVGQELQVEVLYPADYQEPKLAGKTVAYNVTVKAIKKRILPELNDGDFAKELGSYETFAGLEARVRDHVGNRKQAARGRRNQGTGFLPL